MKNNNNSKEECDFLKDVLKKLIWSSQFFFSNLVWGLLTPWHTPRLKFSTFMVGGGGHTSLVLSMIPGACLLFFFFESIITESWAGVKGGWSLIRELWISKMRLFSGWTHTEGWVSASIPQLFLSSPFILLSRKSSAMEALQTLQNRKILGTTFFLQGYSIWFSSAHQ